MKFKIEIDTTETSKRDLEQLSKTLVHTFDLISQRLNTTQHNTKRHKKYDIRIMPDNLPDCKFSKVEYAAFNDRAIPNPKWINLLRRVIDETIRIYGSATALELQEIVDVNIVDGQKVESGFRYISKHDISFQSLDAFRTLQTVVGAVEALEEVKFELYLRWRDHERAAYPGKIGYLCIEGK